MATLSSPLSAMRQGLAEYLGEWIAGTTTANGNLGGTTFIDTTNLVNFANDRFNSYWGLITSGAYATQVRRAKDSIQASGQVETESAYGGQILSGKTYELHRYHPTNELRWALNRGIQEAFPDLKMSLINEDLITGNALPNGSFEDFITSASVPDYWALVGAGATSAKEVSSVRYGKSSVSLTRAGTDCYLHCSDVQWRPLLDLGNDTPWLEVWVLATVASRARIGVSVNGGTPTYSSYHTGSNTWELLRVSTPIAASPNSISVRLCVDTGNTTAYFDGARVLSSDVSTYVLPGAFLNKPPAEVWLQNYGKTSGDESPCDDFGETYPFSRFLGCRPEYDNDRGVWLLRLTQRPTTGYRLRLVGDEYPAELAADTDTVPLEHSQLNLLYRKAAELLFERLANGTTNLTAKQDYLSKMQIEATKYALLKPRVAMPGYILHANYGNWKW